MYLLVNETREVQAVYNMKWTSSVVLILTLAKYAIATTAVLILARGGSKGIRLKNLQQVGGKSLLRNSIEIAQRAGLKPDDDVVVSTDHPLIALEALQSNASVFRRSAVTATDWAPSIWGAAEFLSKRLDIETLVLLQTTSPFVKSKHLKQALKKFTSPVGYDCVFSVTRSFKLRWSQINDVLTPINFNIQRRPRRQDWDGELMETGAFYIAKRHLILTEGRFQNKNCTTWEVSGVESFEIDTYQDLLIANALYEADLM